MQVGLPDDHADVDVDVEVNAEVVDDHDDHDDVEVEVDVHDDDCQAEPSAAGGMWCHCTRGMQTYRWLSFLYHIY